MVISIILSGSLVCTFAQSITAAVRRDVCESYSRQPRYSSEKSSSKLRFLLHDAVLENEKISEVRALLTKINVRISVAERGGLSGGSERAAGFHWEVFISQNTRSTVCERACASLHGTISCHVRVSEHGSRRHTAADPRVGRESHFLWVERPAVNGCAELPARVKLTMKVAQFRSKSIQPRLPVQ